MICLPCRIAADARVDDRLPRCPACKRHVQVYSTASQKIMNHKVSVPGGDPRQKCPGSGKHAMIVGHAACTGCDCQHHPVKEK